VRHLTGDAEVWVAPEAGHDERRAMSKWLQERAADSDKPRCIWHDHLSGLPCTQGCTVVARGKQEVSDGR